MAEIPFEPYTGQSKLRFWCQKVLPLVYDDSLSYYELLGKVVEYLNNTISDVSACEDNITALRDAFVQLQDYVNEQLENVEQTVETIIDEMIDSGEFGEIVADVVNGLITTEYDPTASYAQFAYCLKDGKLYCATAPTTGTWDSTKWRETTVGNDLQILNRRVFNLNAGQVAYNSEGEYDNETVGKELQDLNGYLNPNTTIIQVGSGKEYTSLRTALEFANSQATKINKYIVQLFGTGTYNVANDIIASDYDDPNFVGLIVGANVKLLGIGEISNNKISLEITSDIESSIRNRISTINLQSNGELENVWITAKNIRYATHDDYRIKDYNSKTIRNCRFTSDNTIQHRAYGAGYIGGIIWNFINCIFENINGEETSAGNGAFSAHNNYQMTEPSILNFVNCKFSGGTGAGFGSLNGATDNAISEINLFGCYAKHNAPWKTKPIEVYQELGVGIETSINGFGNNFGNDDVNLITTATINITDFLKLENPINATIPLIKTGFTILQGLTLEDGGYSKIGNLICVNMRFRNTTENAIQITGYEIIADMPTPNTSLSGGSGIGVWLSSIPEVRGTILARGSFYCVVPEEQYMLQPNAIIIVSGSYLARE